MLVRRTTRSVNDLPLLALCTCLAALAGLGAARDAGQLLTVCLGLLAAVAVALRPWLAIVAVLAADGLALLLVLGHVDTAAVDSGVFLLTLTALLASRARARSPLPSVVVVLLVLVALVLTCGLLVASSAGIPFSQSLSGLRRFAVPAICGLIALSMSEREASRVLRAATVLVSASAVAALVEQSLGAGALESAGLTYGVTVRHYQEELRAPGLFATNYTLGAFAGVLGGLAVAWWPTLRTRSDKVWSTMALLASCACLLLSIYRTGIVVLIVSVALWLLIVERRGTLGRRLLTVTAAVSAVGYVFSAGLGSTGSLLQRGQLWRDVVDRYGIPPLGHGLGFSGAASESRFSARTVVVDNYYLSLSLQYGLLAIAIIGPLVVLSVLMLRQSRQFPRLRSGAVLAACLVAFLFVDFWEYTSAMSLAMTAVAVGYGHHRASRARAVAATGGPDDSPDPHGVPASASALPEPSTASWENVEGR